MQEPLSTDQPLHGPEQFWALSGLLVLVPVFPALFYPTFVISDHWLNTSFSTKHTKEKILTMTMISEIGLFKHQIKSPLNKPFKDGGSTMGLKVD